MENKYTTESGSSILIVLVNSKIHIRLEKTNDILGIDLTIDEARNVKAWISELIGWESKQ
jgi:hypothetical protein